MATKKTLSRFMANQETLYTAEDALSRIAFDEDILIDREEFDRRYNMLLQCVRAVKERIDGSYDWEVAVRNIGV